MTEPFSMYSAPTEESPHTLLIIGEAPSEEEAKQGKPLVGPSGELLERLLAISGFKRSQFHITNVFTERPPGNDIKQWTVTKTDLRKLGFSEVGRLPQLQKRYLHPEREPELSRLRTELQTIRPDLTIALGGTALWALTGDGRITQSRGVLWDTDHGGRAIATYHPAAILRQWDLRPLAWADLRKARRWLDGTLEAPLDRRIYINPTDEELEYVYEQFATNPTDLLGVDIETAPGCGQITTVAFATPTLGVTIPVWDRYTLPALCHSYDTPSGEAARWGWIRRFGQLANPKVLQNGLYDMQYLLDTLDLRLRNVVDDTAILQHTLQPELPKALGTLASLYLNEPLWKQMRESAKDDNKADE
jgi:uracil-DNA glycosylase